MAFMSKLENDVSPKNQIKVQIQKQNSEQEKLRLDGAKKLDNEFLISKAMAIWMYVTSSWRAYW